MDKIIIPQDIFDKWTSQKYVAEIPYKMDEGEFDKFLFYINNKKEIAFESADVFIKGVNTRVLTFECVKNVELFAENPARYFKSQFAIKFTARHGDDGIHTFYAYFPVQIEKEKVFRCYGVSTRAKGDKADAFLEEKQRETNEQYAKGFDGYLNQLGMIFTSVFLGVQLQALQKKEKVEKVRSMFASNTEKCDTKKNFVYRVNLNQRIIYEYEKTDVHKEFTRHCEAWNVRGHYRHYKSGKVSFVKPYTKGKGRLNQKEYVV